MSHIPAILVPTDLSADAAVAYGFARRWAVTAGRPIHLVYVDPMGDVRRSPEPARDEPVHRRLADIAQDLATCGQQVTTHIRTGLPAREIIREAEHHAGMIVIAMRDKVGSPHRMLGSTAGKVLRGTAHDTLVVRAPMVDRPVRRILMPVDLSERETGAFDDALAVARSFGASLHLLHVLPPAAPVLLPPDFEVVVSLPAPAAELRANAERYLLESVRRAAEVHVEATTRLVTSPEPVAPILETIRAEDPDLVLMAGHGKHGFSRVVLGSVVEDVVRASERPVLVLKGHRPVHL